MLQTREGNTNAVVVADIRTTGPVIIDVQIFSIHLMKLAPDDRNNQ